LLRQQRQKLILTAPKRVEVVLQNLSFVLQTDFAKAFAKRVLSTQQLPEEARLELRLQYKGMAFDKLKPNGKNST
jgi:hypothetical protein